MSPLAGPFSFGLSLLLSQNRGGSGEEVGIACARHSAAEAYSGTCIYSGEAMRVDDGGGRGEEEEEGWVPRGDSGEPEVVGMGVFFLVVTDNYCIACCGENAKRQKKSLGAAGGAKRRDIAWRELD